MKGLYYIFLANFRAHTAKVLRHRVRQRECENDGCSGPHGMANSSFQANGQVEDSRLVALGTSALQFPSGSRPFRTIVNTQLLHWDRADLQRCGRK
jgi:hypothetical protein